MARSSRSRRQRTGVPEVDALLGESLDILDPPNRDLVAEIVATATRLGADDLDRGDLKIIAGALRELRRTFRVFGAYPGRRVTVFGSARTQPGSPQHEQARIFASRMADVGWMTITGAGPGIMLAANEGAGIDSSFGLNIRLPFEQEANPAIEGDDKLLTFRYFFTRKLAFVKEAHAFALFPGGFGTLDEAFELLTLMQTGKSDLHPIVLLQVEGERYWERFVHFLHDELLDDSYVSTEDLGLFRVCHDVDEAVEELVGFYRNYQSMRYIDDRLVVRVEKGPTDRQLAALNQDFADIVTEGDIKVGPPHEDEIADDDSLHLVRISFSFDRRSLGRLRQLVDRVNAWVPRSAHQTPPEARPQVAASD